MFGTGIFGYAMIAIYGKLTSPFLLPKLNEKGRN